MLLANPPTGWGKPPPNQDSAFGAGIPWVIRANMRCKRVVALQLEIPHHFKFLIISSKELPAGEPEELNTHAHSEQPKPRKRVLSIHTNLRGTLLSSIVCDTSHSSGEKFVGGGRQGGGGTNSTLVVQLCCQQTQCRNQCLRWKSGGVTP